jgi:hypothetical protein
MLIRNQAQPLLRGFNAEKTYLTVPEFARLTEIDEREINLAIRFGALRVTKFPVRGARKFRIESGAAAKFARKFYAKEM